jgi:hypothetical protein
MFCRRSVLLRGSREAIAALNASRKRAPVDRLEVRELRIVVRRADREHGVAVPRASVRPVRGHAAREPERGAEGDDAKPAAKVAAPRVVGKLGGGVPTADEQVNAESLRDLLRVRVSELGAAGHLEKERGVALLEDLERRRVPLDAAQDEVELRGCLSRGRLVAPALEVRGEILRRNAHLRVRCARVLQERAELRIGLRPAHPELRRRPRPRPRSCIWLSLYYIARDAP